MNTDALTLMLCSVGIVTGVTVYFFWRVLTTKPHGEPDSFSDNDAD